MTAHAMKGDKEKCMEAGMNDYMSKPINLEVLADKIDKWTEIEPEVNPGAKSSDNEIKEPMVFDYDLFMENIMDDIVMAREIIEIFHRNAPRQLEDLKAAIDKKEIDDIINSSHSLKGASASVGGIALSDISARIEVEAKSGKVDLIMKMMAELERNYELLMQELDKI
jgi:HPt (histidine-containing phosphotransfer) domain-containing protein